MRDLEAGFDPAFCPPPDRVFVLDGQDAVETALVESVDDAVPVHLAQPGVSWLQLACITMTGSLYGWIRTLSASTAPAAVAHAVYNLTLYGVASVIENARL